jgi:hypothetical protein
MIFVFGNGLSIGFDRRLTTEAITSRVVASLGDTHAGVLRDLAELCTPEDPDTAPVDVARGGFEQLAGPLDRLADALVAMQSLFTGSPTSPLLIGCCVVGGADQERQGSWRTMNAFAAELVRLHATMFTLNYDSLLMSALLEQGALVYDGFRFGALNVPLDRWSEPVTLYQLHGSVAWHRAADGLVYKPRLQAVREEKLLEAWAAGNMDRGFPAVILGDLKTRYTEQYPFSTFYDELHRQLSNESLVIAGGYSFGDRPLNRALARFLSRNTQNRLLVWNPVGTSDLYLDRLRKQLLDKEHPISEEQVSVEQVWLPDAEAVRHLESSLRPDET